MTTNLYLIYANNDIDAVELTYWGQDKMAAIFQMTFLNGYS